MEIYRNICQLLLIQFFLICIVVGQNSTVSPKMENIHFKLLRDNIFVVVELPKELWNREDLTFLANDGIKVSVRVDHFKPKINIKQSIKARIKTFKTCGKEDDVLDEEKKTVGIRYLCQNVDDKNVISYTILFTYGNGLFEFNSSSLKHLELYEKGGCPRSSKIDGISCPKSYFTKED